MELSQIVRLVLRWWWLIALLAIMSGGISYSINRLQKPEYQAATILLVTAGRPTRDGVTSETLLTRQQLAITYKELLVKRTVLDAAAAEISINPADLVKQTQVDLVKDTAILKLTTTASNPQLAADLANAIIKAFMLQEQTLLANPYAMGQSGLTVVESAIPPTTPIGMGALPNAIIGAMFGAVLALGAAFALEYFDRSIRNAGDLAKLTSLPVLAVITKLKGSQPTDMLVTLHKPTSPNAAAYRMIRAQIEFTATERPLRTIIVTSAQPLEGKSITAANLAIALAQTGLRVLLIDANLRQPVLHLLFQRPNTLGLTTALEQLGRGHATDHIVPTGEDHLSLLLSGPLPPNPMKVLVPEHIRMLITELQDHADLLIFDSPPCLDMIDTSLLLQSCDAVLLVVQAHTTNAESILHTYQLLQTSRTHILGTVLNQAREEHPSRVNSFTPVPPMTTLLDSAEDEPPMGTHAQPSHTK